MPDDAHPREHGRRPESRQVLIVVATVLLTWFALGNLQSVTIHFWLSTTKAPLIVVIAVAAALGGAVGASRRGGRRRRKASAEDQ